MTSAASITGKASNQPLNLSIVVAYRAPQITIIKPVNKSSYEYPFNYFNVHDIYLNYSAYDALGISTVWYSIDNLQNITLATGPNASISGSALLSIGNGTHTIVLYANNTLGKTNSTFVTLNINSSLGWFICTTKYNGTTTNFTETILLGKDHQENLTLFTLEVERYGKIVFNVPVNISRDLCTDTRYSYIDAHSNVWATPSASFAYLDSNYLPELNKSAQIWFYNLSFVNPRILKDGEYCPSNVCILEYYTNGIIKFNVTSFTTYSVEETPVVTPAPSRAVKKADFSIKPDYIEVEIIQGEILTKTINITNTGEKTLTITLEKSGSIEQLTTMPKTLALKPGESVTVVVTFISGNAKPDSYAGKILFKSDDLAKETNVLISVKERKPAVDIDVSVINKTINAGGHVAGNITITNLAYIKPESGVLYYAIKDFEGNVLAEGEDSIVLARQVKILRLLKIPESTKAGKYVFYAKVLYDNKVSTDADYFDVAEIEIPFVKISKEMELLLKLLIIVLIITIIAIVCRKKQKPKRETPKIYINVQCPNK